MSRYTPHSDSEYPKNKRSTAQIATWQKACLARNSHATHPLGKENSPPPSSSSQKKTLTSARPRKRKAATSDDLAQERAKRIKAEAAADKSRSAAERAEIQKNNFQRLFNNTKKKLARAIASKLDLRHQLKELTKISIQNSTRHAREVRILLQITQEYQSKINRVKVVARESRFLLKDACRKLRCMRLHHMRLQRDMERRIQKSVRRLSGKRLYVKGQFTKEARRLMRTLVNLGCPLRSVGEIIRSCIEATGATIDAVPSARTVWRALIEGGLASKAQIIAELRRARGKILATL